MSRRRYYKKLKVKNQLHTDKDLSRKFENLHREKEVCQLMQNLLTNVTTVVS